MPPNPEGDAPTSERRIKAIEAAYLAAAEGGDAKAPEAIRLYFGFINDRVRLAERVRLEAEPKHLEALLAFAGRAFRRPLTTAEAADLRADYARSRRDGLGHEDAMRELVVGGPDVARLPLPARSPRDVEGASSRSPTTRSPAVSATSSGRARRTPNCCGTLPPAICTSRP